MRSNILSLIVLFLVWTIIVLFVDPTGEFMVNDDWSFTKALLRLRDDGQIAATGWGPSGSPGGPAAFVHIIWGLCFTKIIGYSYTALRISVLIMGVAGSIGLWTLLRSTGASAWPSLLATLTLVFNPLFLSQCFTFMTDITFTSMTILSMLFLFLGVKKSRLWLVAIGFFLALAATLTRQFGLMISFGFVIAVMVHPSGRELGRTKILSLAIATTLIPWLAFEFLLSSVGSTPITQHQVFHNILAYSHSKGFLEHAADLLGKLFIVLSYTCFLVSPVLIFHNPRQLQCKAFGKFLFVFTLLFALFEAAIVLGFIDPPVNFFGNIIFNFGIGPVLLKDVYIIGVQRTAALSKPLFYIIVYFATLAMAVCLRPMVARLKKVQRRNFSADTQHAGFLASFCLLTALSYIGIIILTGFHDRYLIPVCALFIVWLVSEAPSDYQYLWSWATISLSLLPLLLIASFAVAGTRDFMQMKRSLQQAHHYLMENFKVGPCVMDGGFEFNGFHCYQNSFKAEKGLSWWWVSREDFLVTLGSLPGYATIKTFNFDRYMGPDGAIHILSPR